MRQQLTAGHVGRGASATPARRGPTRPGGRARWSTFSNHAPDDSGVSTRITVRCPRAGRTAAPALFDTGGLQAAALLESAGLLLMGLARNGAGFDLALGARVA
ncbi:hypothetical protein GCM10027596_25490 [Nocardioides korecus]